jgi:flagellar hook-associated protein 1
LSDLLSIGRSGLGASKKSLEVTGHNISNANTEGYSRQRVDQVASRPIRKSGVIVGTGTDVRGIHRIEQVQMERKIHDSISDHSFHEEGYSQLNQVQEVFNELDTEGISQVIGNFFNSFRQLANEPENEAIRSIVRDNANVLTTDFKRVSETLDKTTIEIDKQIRRNVDEINNTTNEVAKLNKQIATMEASGDETGDLRDQRDLFLRDLSKYFKINTYTDNRGSFVVNAEGVGSLVTAGQTLELIAKGVTKDKSSNNMPGSMEIYFKAKPNSEITNRFRGGKIGSLIQIRNKTIVGLKNRMDKLAYGLVNQVNEIHRQGYSANRTEGKPGGEGINFFTDLDNQENASLKIQLTDEVNSDLANIMTASKPNSPGDNSVAIKISQLQFKKSMDDGKSTIEEYFLQNVGSIGVQTGKAEIDREQANGILNQAKTIKDRITGVSLDEEAANMVKYQHAYQASAKVIQAAEEMFKTLINISR